MLLPCKLAINCNGVDWYIYLNYKSSSKPSPSPSNQRSLDGDTSCEHLQRCSKISQSRLAVPMVHIFHQAMAPLLHLFHHCIISALFILHSIIISRVRVWPFLGPFDHWSFWLLHFQRERALCALGNTPLSISSDLKLTFSGLLKSSKQEQEHERVYYKLHDFSKLPDISESSLSKLSLSLWARGEHALWELLISERNSLS